MTDKKTAIVAGCGSGVGSHFVRALSAAGYAVAAWSRSGAPAEGAALSQAVDVTDPVAVPAAAAEVEAQLGPVAAYIHNAGALLLKPFEETTPEEFEAIWRVTLLGAVNGAQAVLPGMRARGAGALLLVGATASVKGGPKAAAFASAKFALRGLSESLARAYGPLGVHVAHLVIDGVIWGPRARDVFGMAEGDCLSAGSVAAAGVHLIGQSPDCWTLSMDVRPAGERF